jgi:hypothetical protein
MKKKAERLERTKRIIQKRLDFLKKHDDGRPDSSGTTYYEKMLKEPGRLRDKHPYDCGRAKCMCCHGDKILDKKKPSDKRKEIKWVHQVKEKLD